MQVLAEIALSDVSLVAAAIILVVAKVIEWQTKRKKDTATRKYGDPDTVRKCARLDSDIHELLSELRQQANACRVLVYQFHNGERYHTGGPIQRMTCTYESAKGGTSHVMDDQKGISVSMMAGFLDKMYDDTPMINQATDLRDTQCKIMLDNLSVIEFACVPLNQDKIIIGCLMVHWYVGYIDQPSENKKAAYDRWFEGAVQNTVKKIEQKLSHRLSISGTHS